MKWHEALLKYGKQAFDTGKELRFAVIKRQNIRKWRIYLTSIETHGEEQVIDEE